MKATYKQIYEDLRHSIEDGTCPFRSYLPSESQLIEAYGSTHNTVRRALAILAQYGYTQPVHGKGVRVIWRPNDDRTSILPTNIEAFSELVERSGISSTTRVLTFEPLTCDAQMAHELGFFEGEELLHIERIRLIDGQAVIYDKNYFLASAVEGLTPEQAATSIYTHIEGTLKRTIAITNRTITIERATERDLALLDLGDADFLAVVTGNTFDANGEMFERTQSRHHPDCFYFINSARRLK